ncbi:MAG: hypothetical protein NVS3B5_19690 [Sphingomicrobium sp.]
MEQRNNQLLDGAPQDEAANGPARVSEQPRAQGQGQSSANDAGLRQGDTMSNQDRAPSDSTSAQRAGGQSQGGLAMGNESFEGSSLGGQASSDAKAPQFVRDEPNDSGENCIDPTTGEANSEGCAPDGHGAADPMVKLQETGRDPAKSSDLDGQ